MWCLTEAIFYDLRWTRVWYKDAAVKAFRAEVAILQACSCPIGKDPTGAQGLPLQQNQYIALLMRPSVLRVKRNIANDLIAFSPRL